MCAHSKWLKSFAEAEHFDINVANRALKQRAFCSFHAGQLSGVERERGALERKGWRVSPGGSLQRRGNL